MIDSNLVYQLIKSLYGLKQAPREWHTKLSAALLSKGYKNSKNDHSLFCKKSGTLILFLAIYVDDIFVVGRTSEITSIKQFLDSVFKIKDLGDLYYFLGLEFEKVPEGVVMSQQTFTNDLLTEFECLQESAIVFSLD